MKIQHNIGRPIVAYRHTEKSLSEPGKLKQATIKVTKYKHTNRITQRRAAICFGVLFFFCSIKSSFLFTILAPNGDLFHYKLVST